VGCRFHPRCAFATEDCIKRPPMVEVGKDRFVACFHLDKVHEARLESLKTGQRAH